jgi:hypothetical protein
MQGVCYWVYIGNQRDQLGFFITQGKKLYLFPCIVYLEGRTMKTLTLLFILLLFIIQIPSFGIAINSNKIIYVDDSNLSGPWDGSMEHPYQHI